MEALKEHFKNSKFPCEMEHYLPVVFSPPRDGKQLTEPFPVVGSMVRMGAVDDKMEGRDHRVVAGSSGGGVVAGGDDDDKLDVK